VSERTFAGIDSPLAEKSATFRVVSIRPSILECEDKEFRRTGKKWKATSCIAELSTTEDDHIFSVTVDASFCDLKAGDELHGKIVGSSCTAWFPLECDSMGEPLHPPDKDLAVMSCETRTSWFLRNHSDLKITKRTPPAK